MGTPWLKERLKLSYEISKQIFIFEVLVVLLNYNLHRQNIGDDRIKFILS